MAVYRLFGVLVRLCITLSKPTCTAVHVISHGDVRRHLDNVSYVPDSFVRQHAAENPAVCTAWAQEALVKQELAVLNNIGAVTICNC